MKKAILFFAVVSVVALAVGWAKYAKNPGRIRGMAGGTLKDNSQADTYGGWVD